MNEQQAYWQQRSEELLHSLSVDSEYGLSTLKVKNRLKEQGLNTIRSDMKRHVFIEFARKFLNPIVVLLMFAALLALFVNDAVSAVLILVMIFLSVCMDFIQEYKARSMVEALQKKAAMQVSVIRDGLKKSVQASHLVAGDIVEIHAGQRVPADGVVLNSNNLYVDQSVLTGENFPIEKRAIHQENLLLVQSVHSAFHVVLMGSTVVSGYGKVLIVKTGLKTELGQMTRHMNQPEPPSDFSLKLKQFSVFIFKITTVLVLLSFMINLLLEREWLESVLFALALAVGLTPEFLPIQLSVAFAHAAKRLSYQKVIVKRLAAIQDMGNMSILCTDKTGTLTEARIKIGQALDMNGEPFDKVLEFAGLNSAFQEGISNPLDTAILSHTPILKQAWTKIDEAPFDSSTRRSVVLLQNADSEKRMIAKGAPESILPLCDTVLSQSGVTQHLDHQRRIKILNLFESLSADGFRLLAVATRAPHHAPDITIGSPKGLTFCGFITFMDPPKATASKTLKSLRAKGVEVKILTGDHVHVTEHLCKMIAQPIKGIFQGEQLSKMNVDAFKKAVEEGTIFARVSPTQKHEIVKVLKECNHVVGFVGDGINDAPALHEAHIGISVDSASDVARASADLILLEKSLSVIHQTVLEGRRTFQNLMKYIMMMTSSNLGNMISMVFATVFLPFIPMLAVQILLNNFLYDLSQIAIPWDRVDDERLEEAGKWDMDFIKSFMIIFGSLSTCFDLFTFYVLRVILDLPKESFQTAWFIESLATQILVIFVIRTRRCFFNSKPHPLLIISAVTLLSVGFIIPLSSMGTYFSFVMLSGKVLLWLITLILSYLLSAEIIKGYFFKRFRRIHEE